MALIVWGGGLSVCLLVAFSVHWRWLRMWLFVMWVRW
jgi:hypothetical protein